MRFFQIRKRLPDPVNRVLTTWYWALKARRLPRGVAPADDLVWFKVRALHRLGRSAEALEVARAAAVRYPDRQDLQNFIAQRELESVQRQLARGDFEDALAQAEAIQPRTDYQRRVATLARSRALRQLGRLEESVAQARIGLDHWWTNPSTGIAANPVHARNLVELANLAEAWRELLAIAKYSLRADPANVEMLGQIAWALRKMRRIKQVERLVRHVVWRSERGRMPLDYFVDAMRALDSRAPVLKYQAEIETTGNRQAKRSFVELLIELSYAERALHLMEKWRIARFELSERNQAPLRRLTGASASPDQAQQFTLEHDAILRLRDFQFPERPPLAPNGPTRVLVFASTLGVGGAERQLANLLDNLALNPKFDITLVIFQKVKVETVLEARSRIKVVYVDDIMRQHDRARPSILPRPLLLDVQSILRRQKVDAILNWAAQHMPDVVYHAVGLPTDAIIVGHVLRVPIVAVRFGGVTFRNNFNASDRQYQDQVVAEDFCSVFADRVSFITNSQAACDAWSERLGINLDKFDVIPNGSPIPATSTHSKKAECERLFDDPDVIVVGWVGRFHDVKRPQLWIEVALRLAAEQPALRFLLVGSGPLLQGLRRRVETTPYGDRFLFTGHVSEGLSDLYKAMDILLVTSRTESFPNVVLEALGQGAYVVSAAVGGVPEIVNSNLLGRLVDSNDIEDFAARMRETLADLAAIDRDRSRRAALVRETYSLQSMVSRYEKKFRPDAERSRKEQDEQAPVLAADSAGR